MAIRSCVFADTCCRRQERPDSVPLLVLVGKFRDSEWRFLGCEVVVLGVSFSEFCVSRSFRTVGFVAAAFVRLGKNGCFTDVLKVSALWCFVAGFCVIVLFHVGTSVCAQYWVLPYFICFTFLFETFVMPCMCMYGACVIVLTIFFWLFVLWKDGGEGDTHSQYCGGSPLWTSLTFFWCARWSFSTFVCKLSSYLVACVAVNYVYNFGGFNGELFGYSTRASSLVFAVFFFGHLRPHISIFCRTSQFKIKDN